MQGLYKTRDDIERFYVIKESCIRVLISCEDCTRTDENGIAFYLTNRKELLLALYNAKKQKDPLLRNQRVLKNVPRVQKNIRQITKTQFQKETTVNNQTC